MMSNIRLIGKIAVLLTFCGYMIFYNSLGKSCAAQYLIIDKISQQIIGTVFLKDFDWNVGKVEIGFFIDKDFVNKGIISKAVSFVIDYAFKELKLNKIFMRVSEDNLPSRRVAEKNNFEVEGKLRRDFKTSDGELIDVIYYGVLK